MTESKFDPKSVPLDVAAALAKGLAGLQQTGRAARPVIADDLVAYLNGEREADRDRISLALKNSPDLASLFSVLLSSRRNMHAPRLVAAQSSAEVTERQGDRFSVRLRKSNAKTDQVYVILVFDPLAPIKDGQSLSLLVQTADSMVTSSFPELHDLRTQIIVDHDSELCAMLRDPDSEISIINTSLKM